MACARMLSASEAREFYDRFGLRQDRQAWYEDPAIDAMIDHAAFERASRVVEIGCGTGRLARRLLGELLPGNASYVGLDLSDTMVGLSTDRLKDFAGRVRLVRADCSDAVPLPDDCCDRLVSSYVLDLLSTAAIGRVLAESRRLLEPGGMLCLTALAEGSTWSSRAVASLWRWVHRLRPQTVGGCRPLRLAAQVPASQWRIRDHGTVCVRGLASEWLVAEPAAPSDPPPAGGAVR